MMISKAKDDRVSKLRRFPGFSFENAVYPPFFRVPPKKIVRKAKRLARLVGQILLKAWPQSSTTVDEFPTCFVNGVSWFPFFGGRHINHPIGSRTISGI